MNNNLNVVFDIEGTSGSYLWADPISISYIVTAGMEENFKVIQPMRTFKAKSRKSRCYEIDAYLVNGLNPFEVQNEKLTNFQLIKKIHEEFVFWGKKGANFICYNGYSYDFSLIEANLHSQLFDWIWIFNTGGASKIDMLPICRNIEYYTSGIIKTEKNEKQNKIFRLASLCNENNFPIKSAHTSADDTEGLLNLVKYCATKAPDLFKKSLEMKLKINVKPKIQSQDFFCFTEFLFGKSRNVVGTYFSEGIFPNYYFVIDLKTDVETFFSIKSDEQLAKALKGSPRPIKVIKANRNPLILDQSYATREDDEYKAMGYELLKKRSKIVKQNREKFAERVKRILREQYEEKNNMNQAELLPEQQMFTKPSWGEREDMKFFVSSTNMEQKRKIYQNFKKNNSQTLKHLAELQLLDEYDREAFMDSEYKILRKRVSTKLFSTNNEPFITIPSQMARADTLKIEEEENGNKKRLDAVLNLDAHLNKFAEDHEKYL